MTWWAEPFTQLESNSQTWSCGSGCCRQGELTLCLLGQKTSKESRCIMSQWPQD